MLTFEGEETFTLECTGSFSREHARALVPSQLPLERDDDRAVLGLLYFEMRKLSAFGLGWPSFSYRELFWRVGILLDGQPAWFGLRCEMDDALVQKSAEVLFQYTTTRATFQRTDTSLQSAGDERTTIRFEARDTARALPPRRLLVSRRGVLYEVGWRERPADEVMRAEVSIVTSWGLRQLTWERGALLLRGRTHICQVARALEG